MTGLSSSTSQSLPPAAKTPNGSFSVGRSAKSTPTKKKPKPYPIWLGGASASIAAVCTHPLDVAKVRMQTSKNHSMFGVLAESIQRDGIRKGAYPGLSASLLRQLTYSLTRFAVYDTLKDKFSDGTGPIPPLKLALAASVAGAAGGLAGNPADIVLVRMIGDVNRPIERRLNYRHAADGVVQIVKTEGPLALFRGLAPNTARAILMNASQLATYDTFKDMLLASGHFVDGLGLHFTAGLMAGTVATTITQPFDVVKSRIMNASGEASVASVISRAFKREGVGWMLRGWTPAWVRLGPNSLIIFLVLEQMRNAVDRARAQDYKI